jgi:GntR family transcriptional regulator / MocR family aminotransferase
MEVDEPSWLTLNRRSGETLRAALERTLRDAIRSGALREGVRLPSSRVLAQSLSVSRGVVRDAYGQLEGQGFLVTRPRAAPVVAAVPRPPTPRPESEPAAPVPRYDLIPTTPDVTLFPLNRWLATAQQVARRASVTTLDYGDNRGERTLRAALADHLGRTRGVIAEPDQIIVVQGTAQAVDLLLRVLLRRGASRVAVEDPSHTTNHQRVREFGLDLVGQPVDAHGIVVAGLDADAVLVTPAHQFPTGSVLSGERRRHLLAWSRASGGLIVEDDYDAEFRYDRARRAPCKASPPSRSCSSAPSRRPWRPPSGWDGLSHRSSSSMNSNARSSSSTSSPLRSTSSPSPSSSAAVTTTATSAAPARSIEGAETACSPRSLGSSLTFRLKGSQLACTCCSHCRPV